MADDSQELGRLRDGIDAIDHRPDPGPSRVAAPVREPAREPAESGTPQPVHDDAVPDQRVQARVAGQHLPRGAGGGVAVEHHRDVFAQTGKHALILAYPS